MLFELVVSSACTAEVAAAGLSAVFPWDRVVQVGARGGLATDRIAAGEVAGDHVLAQPQRWPVGIGCGGVRSPADGGVGFGLDQGTLQRPFGGAQRSRDDAVQRRPGTFAQSGAGRRPGTSGRPSACRWPNSYRRYVPGRRPGTYRAQGGDGVLT